MVKLEKKCIANVLVLLLQVKLGKKNTMIGNAPTASLQVKFRNKKYQNWFSTYSFTAGEARKK
jgi:hypothetical protein